MCGGFSTSRTAYSFHRRHKTSVTTRHGHESIFVALAAYEDPELIPTLFSLLHAAEFPERIIVGIVWQGVGACPVLEPQIVDELATRWIGASAPPSEKPDASSSLEQLAALGLKSSAVHRRMGNRLRVLELPTREAKGPQWARYLQELLWEPSEPWYCQMDSHMRMASGWDTACINEIQALEAEAPGKKMLTCYGSHFPVGAPHDWAQRQERQRPRDAPPPPPLVLAASHFDEDGVCQLKGRRARRALPEPRRTYLFSANFSFSRAGRLADAPYDPMLPYLFHGEEVLMAVRLHTHGWDLFTPSRARAFHLWDKGHRPTYDAALGPKEQAALLQSRARLAWLLGQSDDGGEGSGEGGGGRRWPRPNGLAAAGDGASPPTAFGLGSVRSLHDYEAASGVCFSARQLDERARNGYLLPEELGTLEDAADAAAVAAQLTQMALSKPLPVRTQPQQQPGMPEVAGRATLEALLGPAAGNAGGGNGLNTASSSSSSSSGKGGGGGGSGGGGGPSDEGGIGVLRDALPAALAREARSLLSSLPLSAWEVADTPNQPLPDASARPVAMHYRRNPRGDGGGAASIGALRAKVSEALSAVLAARPFESLLLNFSRYDPGDFLDSHGDTPSGSKCYERRVAFVWHLSEGWREEDGGAFVDEEAAGTATGERHFAPTFNTLVTFAVPRMHRVTRVKPSARAPRFAVYGWIAAPEIARPPSPAKLRALLGASEPLAVGAVPRATAVLLLPRRPGPKGARALEAFAALPMAEVGLGRQLGEYCRFVVAPSDAAAQRALGLTPGSDSAAAEAAAAEADGDACALCVWPPDAEGAHGDGAGVARGGAKLPQDAEAMRAFVEAHRKAWSPVAELDLREPLVMCDMYFSDELKLFVFAGHHTGRPQPLVERLDRWAKFLRPHARLYLCDPLLCEPVLAEFGLAPTHAPTAVAYDTKAAREGAVECRWRMADLYGAAGPPRPSSQGLQGGVAAATLDVAMLTKFVVAVCKLRTPLGAGAAQLALL